MVKTTRAFQENLSTIFDELHLAKKWGKASILLTIHKSIHSQEKTKKAIRKKMENCGFSIVELEFNKIEGNFIKYMLQRENIENVIFYISNIDWGGGKDGKDGYRNLNLYRETFVEQNIKVIFFLTLNEATNIPTYAPDFWVFRHHVLKFGSPRTHNQKRPPVGLMLWHEGSSFASNADIKSKISSLTKLLAEIPDKTEVVSLRIDLQYELGFQYWYLGDHLNAEKALKKGIELANAYEFIAPLVKLQNGLAIICYERENFQCAIELLEPMIAENPGDCLLLLNQAVVLFAMKRRYNAIKKGRKAASICAQNSRVWNSLGFLYYFSGNMDDAEICFQKAIDISPTFGYFYESLAICFLAIGLRDKANAQLYQAQMNSDNREIFQKVLKECIEGNTENAILLIEAAMDAGELTKLDIVRDPILTSLIDPGKLAQI